MTVSIMDGHTGQPHVTSDDWAAFNAATYGNQGAVLGSDSFNLTMETSTKGTLSAGLGIVQGRRFRVTDSETLAFDAVGVGMKRTDIVVARYSNADGIESVSIAVVKGKENATSAVSPQVENGDLPLWKVVFDGVNVFKGYPARVTGATPSIAYASATAATLLETKRHPLSTSPDVHASKVGNIVIVSGSSQGDTVLGNSEWVNVGTLPSDWRPKQTEYAAGSSYTADAIAVRIETNGNIYLEYGGDGSVKFWTFNAVFAL